MSISVHVVDGSYARAAGGLPVILHREVDGHLAEQARSQTNDMGSVPGSFGAALSRGQYRLELDLDGYFTTLGIKAFFRSITVELQVADETQVQLIYVIITPSAYVVGQELK